MPSTEPFQPSPNPSREREGSEGSPSRPREGSEDSPSREREGSEGSPSRSREGGDGRSSCERDASAGNHDLRALIRTIPDFPKPGILFRDVTTLLLSADGFAAAVARMAASVAGPVDLVAGIEARGFLFAAALAGPLGAGVLPVRKDGKLPGATVAEDYALEYGTDRIAIHADACVPGQRVLLVDDLIATGGTARAAARLLRRVGAAVTQARFLVDLPDLGGADALRGDGIDVGALVGFPGH